MWTLGAPAMLGWLAAASIPLLLWWWHRPRRHEISFAAMQFLEQAIKLEGSRRSWLQWWLLALQIAAVVLLAIGWADLLWLTDRTSLTQRNWQVLVIDGTMSMAGRVSERSQSNFDLAVQQARQTVQASRPVDVFSLFVLRKDCDVVIGQPTGDSRRVLQELDRLEVSYAAGEMQSIVQPLVALVSEDESPPPADRLIIHLYSEMQLATWPKSMLSEWKEIQSAAQRLEPTWQLHDVGPMPSDNLAVKGLVRDTDLVMAGQEVTLWGSIYNYSNADRDVRTTWLVDGELVAEYEVSVPSGRESSFPLQHRFASAGDHTVELVIDDDALQPDNRRFMVVSILDEIRVLVIGRPEATRPTALALAVNQISGRSAIQAEERTNVSALAGDLSAYDIIIFANIPGLSAAESKQVDEYLQAGGSAVVLLGDRSPADDWSKIDWLPTEVEVPSQPELAMLDPLAYGHPLLRAFRGTQGGGLLTVPSWQHFRLEPRSDSEVVMKWSDGSPALVAGELDVGSVIVWSIPWESQSKVKLSDGSTVPWSALSEWPCFVPLVQETVRYLLSQNEERPEVLVGERLLGTFPSFNARGNVQITRPDGRAERLAVAEPSTQRQWNFDQTQLPGFYEVSAGSTVSPSRWAVNVSPHESAPYTQVAANQLPEARQIAPTAWDQFGSRIPWYRLFLGLALGALLTESLLTWWQGRISK